jgi:DNA-binding FrmR family transcriptional regulator
MYFSSAVAVKAEFTLDCKAIKRFLTAIFGSVQKTGSAFINSSLAEAVNNNSSESSIASIV